MADDTITTIIELAGVVSIGVLVCALIFIIGLGDY